MDFDDLLINFNEILKKEDISEIIRKRYEYILVDEYQDINWIQNEIIERLNEGNNNLFVAGDAEQAIYSWRGSKVSFIQNFQYTHKNCNVFPISHNYRSDGEILKLAENAISYNYWDSSQAPKIIPYLPHKNKPILFEANDDNIQADYIASEIKKKLREGIRANEIAVLVRANYLTKIIEKTFRQNGIPYKLLAGYSFFEREHIRDLLAFLKFIDNPQDEFAFARMAGLFEGIGEKTIENLFEHFKNSGYDISSLSIDNTKGKVKLSKNAKEGLTILKNILDEILKNKNDIKHVLSIITSMYYEDYLKNTKDDYLDRKKDIQYLMVSSKSYKNLSDFISDMVLDVENEEEVAEENKVIITTVHKAKGLEWDCVFIPYLNEGIFPGNKTANEEDVREERRLFYVAVTRAKKYLYMSNIAYQSQYGDYNYYEPSRFIEEVDNKLYTRVNK